MQQAFYTIAMRKTDRLFELIQILRASSRPVTASDLAEQLEVSVRTVYRDIQALQAMRTPIDGEAGVGYIMRRGYDLPPVNFDSDEIEAIVVGLNLLARTGDTGLQKAANRVINKLDAVKFADANLQVSHWTSVKPGTVSADLLRSAIRNETKLQLRYTDASNNETLRTVLPIVLIYYVEAIVLVAWCELRNAFRHFRLERMHECHPTELSFSGRGAALRELWQQVEE
jgi:predicted DNA-binding transcriptional regulator YafY